MLLSQKNNVNDIRTQKVFVPSHSKLFVFVFLFLVFWANGVQIIPPHDKGILETINQNLMPWQTYDLNIRDSVIDVTDELTGAYFNEISQKYSWRK